MGAKDLTDEMVKGHCPECGPNRWAHVRAVFVKNWDVDDRSLWGSTAHRVLQCPACETVYHQTDSVFSESVDYYVDPDTGKEAMEYNHSIEHWPAPFSRARPKWLMLLAKKDIELSNLFEDTYLALDNNLSVLAAIGLRTVFDKASEVLGIDPSLRFEEKLTRLLEGGWIGPTEKSHLEILTDAGGAAAHRGWRPTAENLDIMMSTVERFLEFHFVARDGVQKLKDSVPPKPKRRKNETQPEAAKTEK